MEVGPSVEIENVSQYKYTYKIHRRIYLTEYIHSLCDTNNHETLKIIHRFEFLEETVSKFRGRTKGNIIGLLYYIINNNTNISIQMYLLYKKIWKQLEYFTCSDPKQQRYKDEIIKFQHEIEQSSSNIKNSIIFQKI